jgi:hypothetical protein
MKYRCEAVLGHSNGRLYLTTMAVPTREGCRVRPIVKLSEILGVEIGCHLDHDARCILHWILIARKVDLLRL